MASEAGSEQLEQRLLQIQRSTRTSVPGFIRLHNGLRMKSRFYYWWHTLPFTSALHGIVLISYIAALSGFGYHTVRTAPAVQASTLATYDLADTSNFHVRLDGAAAGDQLGVKGIRTADFNGNGKNDLIVGAYYTDHNSVSNSGSVYVVFDFEDKNLTGTGNLIDFADTSNYNLRFDGTHTNSFGSGETTIAAIGSDYNGDNKEDLLIFMGGTNELGTNVGSVYLISSDILTASSGTGNAFSLANSSSYTLRINGPVALDVFGGLGSNYELTDIDGDGKNDLIVGSPGMDNNAPQTGSVFVISSTILDDYTGTGNTLDITDTSKFNIRFDGEATFWSLAIGPVLATDINGNGKNDLIMGNGWSDSKAATSANNAGTVHIIYDDLLRSHFGTGNIVNMADHDTWNVRIDGAASGDQFSAYSLAIADIDGDGKPDLAAGSNVSDNNSRTDSGSVWIINNILITALSGTGNILDLAASGSYSIRLDGAVAGDALSYNNVAIADFNNDGRNDLLTGAHRADHNSRTDSGSAYFMDSSVLRSYTGTGNLIDMADTSKYSIRWDAAAAGDRVTTLHKNMEDYNGDGIGDLVLDSYSSNFNSRNDSGSIYIIYNFPHTIPTPTVEGDSASTDRTVTGSITATNSITTISNVQASINTNTFAGTWTDCAATDGSFNSRDEAYSCSLTLPSTGTHTIRIRAKDSNGVYTPVNNYKAVTTTYSIAAAPEATPTSTPTTESTATPTPDTTTPSLSLNTISGILYKPTYKTFSLYSQRPRPVFAGTTEASATVKVLSGDAELCTTTADSAGAWTCTSSLLEHKDYEIEIVATDSAGNETRLPKFTLRISASVPTTEASPSTTSDATTATPVTVELDKTSSPTTEGAYTTLIARKNGVITLGKLQTRLIDKTGKTIPHAQVTLYSEPQTATSDYNGIVTFRDVPVGEHTLEYTSGKTKVRVPITIALAAEVEESLNSTDSVEITLAPIEVKIPIKDIGIITILWLIVVFLSVMIGGYFGYRQAARILPQWQHLNHHEHANMHQFESEIGLVQHSTQTTWPAFARAHNWLRMHSRAYYWWHIMPRTRYLGIAFLVLYALLVGLLIYKSWLF